MGKFVPNSAGFRQLFTSPEMQAVLMENAQKVAAKCNGKVAGIMHTEAEIYHAGVSVHANTAVGRVWKASYFNAVDPGDSILRSSIQ